MSRTLLSAIALIFMLDSAPTSADLALGVPHEKRPLDQVVVGGQPTRAQLEAARDSGVTTVVNLRREGEFDDFDEAHVVRELGLRYVHIPLRNIDAIEPEDARRLHEAIESTNGVVLLHCTVGWRAGGLLAIERYLQHGMSRDDALALAAAAHMDHATGDVAEWIDDHNR